MPLRAETRENRRIDNFRLVDTCGGRVLAFQQGEDGCGERASQFLALCGPGAPSNSCMRSIARILFVASGTIALGFVFYKFIGPLGHGYELNFARNDGDLGQAYMVALAVQFLALIVGGWLGDWVFRKWRHKQPDRQ
ncbi:hypothetical protein LJR099_000467 [Variovorax paradoxus]